MSMRFDAEHIPKPPTESEPRLFMWDKSLAIDPPPIIKIEDSLDDMRLFRRVYVRMMIFVQWRTLYVKPYGLKIIPNVPSMGPGASSSGPWKEES